PATAHPTDTSTNNTAASPYTTDDAKTAEAAAQAATAEAAAQAPTAATEAPTTATQIPGGDVVHKPGGDRGRPSQVAAVVQRDRWLLARHQLHARLNGDGRRRGAVLTGNSQNRRRRPLAQWRTA